MEKITLIIIILIVFLFSSKSWEVSWDISKSLLYIIVGIFMLNILDRNFSNQIKKFLTELINLEIDQNDNITYYKY